MVEAVTRTLCRLALLLALLAFPSAVFAHRLDEYLQATLVAIEPSDVRLQINLTPGVAVAEKVLAADRPRPRRRDFQERSGSLCRIAEARSHAPHGRAKVRIETHRV